MSVERHEQEERYQRYYKGLPVAKKRKIDKQLETLESNDKTDIPLKYQIIESQIPDGLKIRALGYYKNILEGNDNEYSQRWID